MVFEAYDKEASEVIRILNSSALGLSSTEAKSRLSAGYNELERKDKFSSVKIFIRQFKNVLLGVLLLCAVIAFYVGESVNSAVILAFVVIVVVMGFLQEYRSEKALDALKDLTPKTAVVLRDERKIKINAREIVAGDIIILDTGDRVPCDARVIEEIYLFADESVLTGESVPVKKSAEALQKGSKKIILQDRINMVFSGTVITSGRCTAIATGTGMNTEIGKIAGIIMEEELETPLEIKMRELGKSIAVIIFLVCVLTFFVGVLRGLSTVDMLLLAVALAVAAVPESLPLVVGVAVAISVYRMVKNNVIVRRKNAVEALGSVTVICSDKTGTLTKNEMTVKEIYTDKFISVSGSGYKPEGEFYALNNKISDDAHLELLLKIGFVCNNSQISGNEVIGDPTETALKVSALKFKKEIKDNTIKKENFVYEIPFDPERKKMSVVFEENKKYKTYAKGAPEKILEISEWIYTKENHKKPIDSEDRKKILRVSDELAGKGLRVLALAFKEDEISGINLKNISSFEAIEKIEKNLVFAGLAGMTDPVREEVKEAIETCKKAGIMTVMITGDHKITAEFVAEEIGLIGLIEKEKKKGEEKGEEKEKILTGSDLDAMDEIQLENSVEHTSVYARTSSEHKLRIVKALQKKGHVVAMTGDGVNDAPALKRADVGVAMSLKGTEVAREAADMILTDDNFSSIAKAVKEGRRVYDNIKKSACFVLSTAVAEVFSVIAAMLLGMNPIFSAIQILWLNLVTETIPAATLTLEKPEPDVMLRKPRSKKEKIAGNIKYIISIGIFMAAGVLIIFASISDINKARTMAFTALLFFVMFNIFNCRSLKHSVFKIGFFSNKKLLMAVSLSIVLQIAVIYLPFFRQIFGTVPLGLIDWIVIISVSSSVFVLVEIKKAFFNKYSES